jgi:hypothetical protein
MQSCFNYINLNEAQSLGKGNNSVQVEVELDAFLDDQQELGAWGSFEILYTRGITEQYDLGVYLNSNTGIGIYNKYQIYDTEKTDISIGLDAKVLMLSEEAWEVFPNVYFTQHVGKFRILANPSLRFANDFVGNSSRNNIVFTPSITTGIQYGDIPFRFGIMVGKSPYENVDILSAVGLSYNIHF